MRSRRRLHGRNRRSDRDALDPAWSAYVEGSRGKVPVDQVAELSTRQVITRFERRDQSRMIEVRCQIDSGLLSSKVLSAAQSRIDAFNERLAATPDLRLEMAGEKAETAESSGNLSIAFAISFVLIIMTLMIKYNAFGKVAIILFTLLLAAVLTLLVLPALYAFCVEVLRMRVFTQTKEEREAIRAAEAEAQRAN